MTDPDPREEIVTHLPALRAFAVTLSQNQALADDIVQDAVIKAWTNFDKFEEGTNLKGWLFAILRNGFISYRRKTGREIEDIDGIHAKALITKPVNDGKLLFLEIQSAFRKLPLDQREALILIGVSGFTYEEAAALCQVPVGTVKSRANRARARLADELGLVAGESVVLTDGTATAALAQMSAHTF